MIRDNCFNMQTNYRAVIVQNILIKVHVYYLTEFEFYYTIIMYTLIEKINIYTSREMKGRPK